jgi:hypothetical protein
MNTPAASMTIKLRNVIWLGVMKEGVILTRGRKKVENNPRHSTRKVRR